MKKRMFKQIICIVLCATMIIALGGMAVVQSAELAQERLPLQEMEIVADGRGGSITDRVILDEIKEANGLVAPLGTTEIIAIIYAPYGVNEVYIDMQTGEVGMTYSSEIQPNGFLVLAEECLQDISPRITWGNFVSRNPVPRARMIYHYPDTVRFSTLHNNSSFTTSLSQTETHSRTGALSASFNISRSVLTATLGFNYSQTITSSTQVTVHNVPPGGRVVAETSVWAFVVDFRIYEVVGSAHIFAGIGSASRPDGIRTVVWG